ncbi:ABC transporter permease [Roseivirga sp. E12]|uniref:ABC transporter permease n=1 Tax=Roseivirga sp. E12 TaxID=2819237 RepID=UPI001ABBEB57|nr:ABC transporter permease [Roseivirga sp. E12]MBO3697459.1 ABC transporter permease [Roseivirga sp. E12]
MLRNYFKIAFRNLLKNKLYSSINIAGLSVGLAACVLIVLFVRHELSYDEHFEDADSIYRLTGAYNQGGDAKTYSVTTTYPLLPILASNFPEMKVATRFDNMSTSVERGDQSIFQEDIMLVDSTFFDLFSFELVAGRLEGVLNDPQSIVLSQAAAERHFGDEDPMNQLLSILDVDFKVAAVVKDLPSNTHFEAEMFIPNATAINWYGAWVSELFTGTSHYSYFKLERGVDPSDLEARINTFLNDTYESNTPYEYYIQSLKSIHLDSDLTGEIGVNGNRITVLIFIATAVVILLLACINYINLSIAASFQRGMEVGLKKVFGARPLAQVLQFQAESIIIALLSCICAVILVEMALPQFNNLTGGEFDFRIQDDLVLGLSIFAVAVTIGAVAGSFPALFLLRMKTVTVLRNSALTGGGGRFNLRNSLVVFQFFIAVVLIASTLIILNQIKFLRNADLGIDTEQVVVVPLAGSVAENYDLLREELLRNPSIMNVTASNNHPAVRVGNWRGYRTDGAESSTSAPTVVISHDFFETLGAEIIEGRAFDRDFETDYMEAYVLNEAAVDFFKLEDPVGKKLSGMAFTGSEWSTKDARVIGVVKDFHFASLHNEIRPTVFSLSSRATTRLNFMSIRVSPEGISETLQSLENEWNQIAAGVPFDFSFLDEDVNDHYQAEDQFLKVFASFSFLSIAIGCLGLFGLTAFMMKRRTKEIGIRKVLGAEVFGLVNTLSKDFLKLVLVANVLGWPLAYYLMDKWLQNFAYSNGISWKVFFWTGLGAMVIAFISVAYHAIKTASMNPVNSIRYE